MNLRRGIVVATHPEDHSVDLVMTDDGSRLVGVQVATPSGSTRTGTVDLPAVPEKADKWNISEPTDQEMIALVGYVQGNPVVLSFMYPQINQVLSSDPKRRVSRHQSDVQWSIDGDGNIQLDHPSGTYVRIGESPDREETAGANADGNAAIDRNTGRKVHIRIGLAGGAAEITITPDGAISIKNNQTVDIESGGAVTVISPSVTLDTPEATCTGNLTVDGALTYKGGMIGSGGGAAASITGNVNVEGSINATGDILAGGSNSNHHSH